MFIVRSRLSSPRTFIRAATYTTASPKFSFTEDAVDPIERKGSVHPTTPARTRFAPSPTGYLHLGSLRTALYNYLLAKNTNGTFILRLEDTDQKRLIVDAEQNIYDSLKWCGLKIDEGPMEGGPYGPYRQSDRREIYQKYAQILLDSGHAYKCYCSKDRLASLRESAMKLKPPTTVTYDRYCANGAHDHEVDAVPTIRFKSPDVYEPIEDLTHGVLNLQPQYNTSDRRFDDFVIMKADGLPTYHFANIVDDHLMKITHVIRGEEWLSSTPKHVALYKAFGWVPPKFVHIPLLTSLSDKKLSKRSGDIGIWSLKNKGILPEALTNFCALFGWSPARTPGVSATEVMKLEELVQKFSLDNLTKGNAKVDDAKLHFFNKSHLQLRLQDERSFQEIVDLNLSQYQKLYPNLTEEYFKNVLSSVGPSISSINELDQHKYLFEEIDYSSIDTKKLPAEAKEVLQAFTELDDSITFEDGVKEVITEVPGLKKKDIFKTLRYAYAGGASGLTIPLLVELLGKEKATLRLQKALKSL
ncbi:glutamate--tRNA ligase, mitochondrial [[Candida] anglica]|uniref:glutamate--tRNA ligase n=1 Tax=[Candida] anglica TaxID=148631 RepID=A0ABP0E8D2_9ASCO